jgi:hypothetical protein
MLLAHSTHSLRCQKGSCVQSAPNHPPNTKSDQIMNKENKIKKKKYQRFSICIATEQVFFLFPFPNFVM